MFWNFWSERMQPIVIYIFSFESAGMSCLLTCDIPMYRIKITFVSKRSFQNFIIFKKKHYRNNIFWFQSFLNDKISFKPCEEKIPNCSLLSLDVLPCRELWHSRFLHLLLYRDLYVRPKNCLFFPKIID